MFGSRGFDSSNRSETRRETPNEERTRLFMEQQVRERVAEVQERIAGATVGVKGNEKRTN